MSSGSRPSPPRSPPPRPRPPAPTTRTPRRRATSAAPLLAADSVDDGSQLARDLTGGGLFAAALLGALAVERRRRRGRDSSADALEAEVALRVGADADRAARVDRALRGLSAACRTEQKELPSVFAVTVGDDTVDLSLAPPRTDAPAPWTPVDDGRTWRLGADAPGAHGARPRAVPGAGLPGPRARRP